MRKSLGLFSLPDAIITRAKNILLYEETHIFCKGDILWESLNLRSGRDFRSLLRTV